MTAMNKHDDGLFCWNQIATNNVDRAIVFYGALFGWEVVEEELGHGDQMVRMTHNGNFVVGINQIDDEEQSRWEPHLAIEDLKAFLEQTQEQEGFIVEEPQSALPYGTMAEISGPEGARLCLWSAGSFGGHTTQAEVGVPYWYGLQLLEEGPEENFWPALMGWKEASTDAGRKIYQSKAGALVAQIQVLTEDEAEDLLFPRWVTFVQVGDVDSICKDALAIDGTIVTEAHDVSGVGRCAVLADPQGSVFGVIQPD